MIRSISVLVPLLALLLTRCGSDDVQTTGDVLRWNLNSEPKTIDPQLNAAVDGSDVINHLYEGLLREVDGTLQPAIADRWEVLDSGRTYVFHLRETTWSDGQPLTAHHFEYAWKRGIDPTTASEFAFIYYTLRHAEAIHQGELPVDSLGVRALDDTTLEVRLRAPADYFLTLTTIATFMPNRPDIVARGDNGAWAKDPTASVTNGPFRLADYRMGDRIVLERNPHYHRVDSVGLDFIELFMITEASTGLTAYEAGDLDVVDNPPEQEILRLINEEEGFEILPLLGIYYYTVNVGRELFQDVRVRQALSWSIDRERITSIVLKGGQRPAFGVVPAGLRDAEGNDFAAAARDYGIRPGRELFDSARAQLAAAGYPGGEGFPGVTIEYNTSEAHKAIAEAIQEMWRANLGIEVQLSNSEWAVFQDTRIQHDFQVARGGWISDYPDPVNFLDLYITGSVQNYGQWSDTTYDRLIREASTQTGQERFETLYAAHEILVRDHAIIPIYYYTDPVLVHPRIENWEKTTMGNFFFGYARVDE